MGCSVESCGLPRRPPILHLIVRTGVVPLVSSIVVHYSYSSSFVVRSSILDSRFSSFRVLIVLRFSLSISILVSRSRLSILDSRRSAFSSVLDCS
mmetsp:Transcript_28760/g.88169  ORF Transcript_28760/g.88169 Transcript_28760/m.88169 type:complete len:95 (-) Transcript_28760:356-640(-)